MARFMFLFVLLVFAAAAARGDTLDSARAAVDEIEHGHADIAIHLFTHAIQSGELSNTQLSSAFNDRGVAYLLNNQHDLAIRDFNEGLRLDPGNATTLNSRANAHHIKKEYAKAIIDLNEALRIDPDYAQAWNNRGVVHSDLGEYDQAIRDLVEAIRLAPDDAVAWWGRGDAYVKMGEYDRAISDYDQALRLGLSEEDVEIVRKSRKEALRLKNQ